jgi:hypothetical protein
MSFLNPWANNPETQMQTAEQLRAGVQSLDNAQRQNMVDDQTQHAYLNQSSDFNRWTQDLDKEKDRLKHRLKREVWDDAVGGWVKSNMPPLLNDKGIAMIEETIEPLMSKNMINTNLDENQINRRLKNVLACVNDNLTYNFDIYDIDELQQEHIMDLVTSTIIPAPFRAMNDGERRHVRTFTKEGHTRVETSPLQIGKSGMLGMK